MDSLHTEESVVVAPEQPNEGKRMKTMKRVLLALAPVALVALGGVSLFLYSPDSDAAPTVSWAPKSISVEVGAGQSTTTTATFTAAVQARDVTVQVAPALAPYVSVTPSSFSSVARGGSYQVKVTFTAPNNVATGTATGTLTLQQGRLALADALPVSVNIVWPTFDATRELGFSIQYPPGWTFSPASENPVDASAPDLNVKFQFYRHVAANPDELPVEEWFEAFLSASSLEPVERVNVMVGGRDAVRAVVHQMFGVDAVHIYICDGADIREINYSLYDPGLVPEYEMMLQSISCPE